MSYEETVITEEQDEKLRAVRIWRRGAGTQFRVKLSVQFSEYMRTDLPRLPEGMGEDPVHVDTAHGLVRVMEYRGVSDEEVKAWIEKVLTSRRKAA